MNSLIDQLKSQAGIQDNPDQEGLNLFAKLIINEALHRLETQLLKNTESTKKRINEGVHSNLFIDGITDGIDASVNMIKNHFGIEE